MSHKRILTKILRRPKMILQNLRAQVPFHSLIQMKKKKLFKKENQMKNGKKKRKKKSRKQLS